MTKSEILIDHVLITARGFSTTELGELIESLEKLEKQRLKEVLASVSEEDWQLLLDAYDPLGDFEEITLEKVVSCRVMVCGDNVDDGDTLPYFLTYMQDAKGVYRDSFDVDDGIFSKKELLANPEISTAYAQCRLQMERFQEVLESLSEKYRISSDVLMQKMEDHR